MKFELKTILITAISRFWVLYFKLKYGRRVVFGSRVIINHRFQLRGRGRLNIGSGVKIWAHEEPNRFFFYSKKARITIAENSKLNGLTCHCEREIKINKACLIASAVIMDTDLHQFENSKHILAGKQKTKPVEIGKRVWLAGQSVILKGVKVNNDSVVGFRAVVTKDIPKKSLAVGNPAKIKLKSNKV
ncbi:MAG: acyltransferase [Candidatus Moranbacteria bacterium]|nr:acyltransferase [Candidatus Moranbacteria bacterium]